jgi:predicted DCC family thiol-disulfide oxidoreductase YuxK
VPAAPAILKKMNPLAEQIEDRLLVVFDGRCALCHASVRWLLRRDRRDRLRFLASESPTVVELLAAVGAEPCLSVTPATILVLAPMVLAPTLLAPMVVAPTPAPVAGLPPRPLVRPLMRLLVRSDAVLACLGELNPPWPQLAAFARLIPRPLRDLAYRAFARLRYRLARRYDACPLPPSEYRQHFLN